MNDKLDKLFSQGRFRIASNDIGERITAPLVLARRPSKNSYRIPVLIIALAMLIVMAIVIWIIGWDTILYLFDWEK